MDNFKVWRKCDGKQAEMVNQVRQGDRVQLYKIAMPGYSAQWCDVETFRKEFSRRPVTENRYRTARFEVTA